VSIRVAGRDAGVPPAREPLELAEQALRRVKQDGRNRVALGSPSGPDAPPPPRSFMDLRWTKYPRISTLHGVRQMRVQHGSKRPRRTVPPAEGNQELLSRLRSPSGLALIGLNLVVYYLLLRWVADNIHPGRLMDHLRQISGWAVAGSLAINLAVLTLFGARMGLLLGSGFRTAFSIVNIGYALNTLMPLRLGDAMKIYIGCRLYGTPLLGTLAASVTEKLADLLVLILLALGLAAFAAGEMIQSGVLLPFAVILACGTAGFALFRVHIVRIVKGLPKRGPVRRMFIALHRQAGAYPVSRILAFTTAIWALNVVQVYFSFNVFLPDLSLGLADSAILLLIMAFAIAVPSAPAGLGLLEAGIVAYLTRTTGVGNEAALAAAGVYHLVIMLPQLAVTGWLLLARSVPATKGT